MKKKKYIDDLNKIDWSKFYDPNDDDYDIEWLDYDEEEE